MAHWWTDVAPGKAQLEEVSLQTFRGLVADAPPNRNMTEVILHHTESPTVAQWRGLSTWEGIRRYHTATKGWSDIGYHVGVGPDGSVWLLRPVQRTGAHCVGHNGYSIGVAMIGNFDAGHDSSGVRLPAAAEVMGALCKRFALTEGNVWLHRDFADKTCPGTGIDRGDVRSRVQAAMGSEPVPPADHWAKADLEWAVAEGIMYGTRPDDPATRAEVVTMLRRTMEVD